MLSHFDSLAGKQTGSTSRQGKIKVNNLNCTPTTIYLCVLLNSQTYHQAFKELRLSDEITLVQHKVFRTFKNSQEGHHEHNQSQ